MNNQILNILNDYLEGKGPFHRPGISKGLLCDWEVCPRCGRKGVYFHHVTADATIEDTPRPVLNFFMRCPDCRDQNGYFELRSCPECQSFKVKYQSTKVLSSGRDFADTQEAYSCENCGETWKVGGGWAD